MILVVRTDKPEAEVGLFEQTGEEIAYVRWHAHRELEATLLKKIEDILVNNGTSKNDLTGLVVYAGPGSFTGLRIGFAVTNTLAAGLGISNVKSTGEQWVRAGIHQLHDITKPQILTPDYGGEANITTPKK